MRSIDEENIEAGLNYLAGEFPGEEFLLVDVGRLNHNGFDFPVLIFADEWTRSESYRELVYDPEGHEYQTDLEENTAVSITDRMFINGEDSLGSYRGLELFDGYEKRQGHRESSDYYTPSDEGLQTLEELLT